MNECFGVEKLGRDRSLQADLLRRGFSLPSKATVDAGREDAGSSKVDPLAVSASAPREEVCEVVRGTSSHGVTGRGSPQPSL